MESPPSVPEQELDLVSRCRQGDRHSFDRLWKRYSRRIFYFIQIPTGGNPKDTANNLTQETSSRPGLLCAIKAASGLGSSIARNVATDWLRSREANFVAPFDEDQEKLSPRSKAVRETPFLHTYASTTPTPISSHDEGDPSISPFVNGVMHERGK